MTGGLPAWSTLPTYPPSPMPAAPQTWLEPTPKGLYCAPGDFFIDPAWPVARAVVTHGHGDHARPNNRRVLATPDTLAIMKSRFGEEAGGSLQPLRYGATIRLRHVAVRLTPPCQFVVHYPLDLDS